MTHLSIKNEIKINRHLLTIIRSYIINSLAQIDFIQPLIYAIIDKYKNDSLKLLRNSLKK